MKKQTYIIISLCILSFVGSCISYSYLPDIIPVQFNINFEPAKYVSRIWILGMGIFPLLVYMIGELTTRKNKWAKTWYQKRIKSYKMIIVILTLFAIGMTWITIFYGLQQKAGKPINIKLIPILFGLLFVFCGNYFPVIQPNYFIGIRTRWTLAGEISWRKTHRLAGYLYVIFGIFFFLIGLIGIKWLNRIFVFLFIFGNLGLFRYSYFAYCHYDKKINKKVTKK